jgi:SynChlorMet cassette radical SAM/SPASM protein ScmE
MADQVLKMPDKVTIALTGRCNLSCKYCFYADEMVALDDLPTETWLSFFEELCEAGVMQVALSGGEVFSRPDLWELIDGIVRNKMRFGLLSNATLITDDVAARLSQYRRRLNSVQISIDGSKPETHNAIRGPRAFERTMRGVAALKKYHLPWVVRVTINKLNVYDLEATLEMLYRELGLQSFGVVEAFPRGAGQCNNSILEMTPDERRHAFKVMQAFDQAHPGVARGAQAGPLITANLIDQIDQAYKTGQSADSIMPYKTGFLSGCNIMWREISVLHDGTYVPCHQLPHITLGKIVQDSLRDVWYNSPGLKQLRERNTIPLESVKHCQGCKYQQYCTGGCPGIAYAMTGDVNTANPLDCYRAYKGEDSVYAY